MMGRRLSFASVFIIGSLAGCGGSTAVSAHAGDEHTRHEHTHFPVDYSFAEDAMPYAAPASAGDGHFWFRGNLHTHTLWSDGDQFPEVVTQWYVAHGYHFLALSDHNALSRGDKWIDPLTYRSIISGGRMEAVDLYRERFGDWVESREVAPTADASGPQLEVRLKPLDEFRHLFERAGRFIMLEAEEITQRSHVIHVNATNIAELIEPSTAATVEDTIRLNIDAVLEQGQRLGRTMMPHLNHPNFRWAVTAEDMAPVENLQFFEVYNGHRGVANDGDDVHASVERIWDIVLTQRLAELGLGNVYGLAVDDAHNHGHSYSEVSRPGRGWVMVRAKYLTPEHLINAMQAGDFYGSSGVTLSSVKRSDSALSIEIEAEEGVTYTTRFIGTRDGYDASSEPAMQVSMEPVLDATGEVVLNDEGDPVLRRSEVALDVTRRYSADIGEVLATVEGGSAQYVFRGDEIYVRAVVTSSRLHPNPFVKGEYEQAWVQPVIPRH